MISLLLLTGGCAGFDADLEETGEAGMPASLDGGPAGPDLTAGHAPPPLPRVSSPGVVPAKKQSGAAGKGMTWGIEQRLPRLDITLVSCNGAPLKKGNKGCDPYQGDTSCLRKLPILCLRPQGLPRPPYKMTGKGGAMSSAYYRGWSGGEIRLTEPVRGLRLTGVKRANAICQKQFGVGFRMAEHHDGKYVLGMSATKYFGVTWPGKALLSSGGWSFYAYGDIEEESRFWVHINDQQGNCWN